MEIKLNLTEEQIKSINAQLSYYKTPDYLTLSGLRDLATNEYHQFLDASAGCLLIAKRIRDNNFTTGDKNLDQLFFRQAMINNIAPTLCNINARMILANNYLQMKSYSPMNFIESYCKALNGGGVMAGTLTSGNQSTYNAILGNLPIRIKQQQTFDNLPEKQPIRVWTARANNKNDTHATMLWREDIYYHVIDTASLERNNLKYTTEDLKKGLFGRQILHYEWLEG